RLGVRSVVRFLAPPCPRAPAVAPGGAARDRFVPARPRGVTGPIQKQDPFKEKAMSSSAVASIAEIAPDTTRVNIPVPDAIPGGFSFNQYLVVDEMPLLFHTGPKKLFPLICEQIEKVLPVSKLRSIALSHFEADECGSLPDFLLAASGARPVCSDIGAMVSVADLTDVQPLGMADGQVLDLGR